jgi:hypothetical protein
MRVLYLRPRALATRLLSAFLLVLTHDRAVTDSAAADRPSLPVLTPACHHCHTLSLPLRQSPNHARLPGLRGGGATETFIGGYGECPVRPANQRVSADDVMRDTGSGAGEKSEESKDATRKDDFWMGGGSRGIRRPSGKSGENLKMGNAEAVRRFKDGACVLMLDFPAETDFGIDVRSWMVGPKFKGLKMVPAGLHLLYWHAGHGMTQGMWFHAQPSQVLILQWDLATEDFAPVDASGIDADQRERLVEAVRGFEFDSGLAPYPMEGA